MTEKIREINIKKYKLIKKQITIIFQSNSFNKAKDLN